MLQKHKRMALGIGVAVGTAGLVTAIAVPLALKNKDDNNDNQAVVIDKAAHAQVYTKAQALVAAATGNGIVNTTVEKVSTKSNGDTIIEGSIATAATRATAVSTPSIKFVLILNKDGIVLSYTENGADKTAVVTTPTKQADISTAFTTVKNLIKESKLIEVNITEAKLKDAINKTTGAITPITGLEITPPTNPTLTPGIAVKWTFSVAAKDGYKLPTGIQSTFDVDITAPIVTTPPVTPAATTVTKTLGDLQAAVNKTTGVITPITGLIITPANNNPSLVAGSQVTLTFSVAAATGYQLGTTPTTFTVQVTKPTTAVSGWDKPLPTSTLYLKADGTYTTDETKAKEHVSEKMPAAVTIPAATVNSTVVIDGITYTGTAGGYALPSSQTAPTLKVGTNYYTTLQAAATAAGMTAVTTGFVSGTTYKANQPVDSSWTAITGTVYAKTADGTGYTTTKPTDPDSSWTPTTVIGYAKTADGTGYTTTKPTISDPSYVATTAIGYAKTADGTGYTTSKPEVNDDSFIEITLKTGVIAASPPVNVAFSLDPNTGIITDVAAVPKGEIDVTTEVSTASIAGKWISKSATDLKGMVASQPKKLNPDFTEYPSGVGFVSGTTYAASQPPILDPTFTEHAAGSGYINGGVWKQDQPPVLKAGYSEYTAGFFKDKLFKVTQPLDASYTSVSTGWIDASNNYYATDAAMKTAANIDPAGSITYTATAINIDGSPVTPVAAGTATYPGIIAGPYYAKTGGGYVTAAKKTEAIGYVAPVSGTPVTISTPTTTTTITIDTTTYTYTVVPHASTLEQVYEI